MARTAPELIEIFHLCFLTVLRSKLEPSRYVLKGGANLRYFFSSPRYSEEIDFDIAGVDSHSLTARIGKALSSDPMRRILSASGIHLSADDITLQKDTPTTKRWRIFFSADDHSDRLRTKIEFSNRNGEDRLELAAVPASIVEPYALRPPLVQHYLGEAAVEQKVAALAGRPATQARDVFDLELLIRKFPQAADPIDQQLRTQAAEAAAALRFEDFETQAAPFLEAALAELYDEHAWEEMQRAVIGGLLR